MAAEKHTHLKTHAAPEYFGSMREEKVEPNLTSSVVEWQNACADTGNILQTDRKSCVACCRGMTDFP